MLWRLKRLEGRRRRKDYRGFIVLNVDPTSAHWQRLTKLIGVVHRVCSSTAAAEFRERKKKNYTQRRPSVAEYCGCKSKTKQKKTCLHPVRPASTELPEDSAVEFLWN